MRHLKHWSVFSIADSTNYQAYMHIKLKKKWPKTCRICDSRDKNSFDIQPDLEAFKGIDRLSCD